jgi:hypothetical protein
LAIIPAGSRIWAVQEKEGGHFLPCVFEGKKIRRQPLTFKFRVELGVVKAERVPSGLPLAR